MTYQEITSKVAEELNLPQEVVDRTYKSFFLFIRKSIQDLPLKDSLTEEDFGELRTNFNVPSLGKFTCTYDRMCKVKKRFNYMKQLRSKDNEHKED